MVALIVSLVLTFAMAAGIFVYGKKRHGRHAGHVG